MLDEFIAYLNEQVKNDSIYVWGAQGQRYPVLTAEWIKSKESNLIYRRAALKAYERACSNGHRETCRAFDCSGLGMFWLQNTARIYKDDMTANGMKGQCKAITKGQLKRGDWVFRTYTTGAKKGQAYHIGYVVDVGLNVIEAKGRADGVVKRSFDGKYWNAYGRPKCFAAEIDSEPEPPVVFRRLLKKGCGGADVKKLQSLLNAAGGYNLAEDGIFGSKTERAVKAYQRWMNITVDGIAGKATITLLGGAWNG